MPRLPLALAVLALAVFGCAQAPLAATAVAASSGARAASHAPIGEFPFSEGSGLVASKRHPGVYWALRDSALLARRNGLYALRIENGKLKELAPGVDVKRFDVEGAGNVDWEDLALDDEGRLWIGDFGNNTYTRRNLRFYAVAEPDPFKDGEARLLGSYDFRYPDGPEPTRTWNAESLFSADGELFVITKAKSPGIYRVPALRAGAENVLERIAGLTPPAGGFAKPPTAADLSSDGTRLAVTTAGDRVWVYQHEGPRRRGAALVSALASRPPRWSAAYRTDGKREQVEGACFVPKSHDLLLLSESKRLYFFGARFYQASP